MAGNFKKKNNGGRKTTINNTKTAPRHHPVSNHHRPAEDTTAAKRTASAQSTFEGKPTDRTRQQIAEAAYFLWQKRGGSDESNWLEAERLLKAGLPVR